MAPIHYNQPFWTCSAEATAIQLGIMIFQEKQPLVCCHRDQVLQKYNHKARQLEQEPC